MAPYRPTPADLQRISGDVAAISAVQQTFLAKDPDLAVADRAAHQYQVAGGRVLLRVAERLPAPLAGVGLFVPGAHYTGIGRVSMSLGCPHLETDPDFLGLRVAFQTRGGARVDFLAINDPTAPSDNHLQFMQLLQAAANATGTHAPIGSGLGKRNLPDLLAMNARVIVALIRNLGVLNGLRVAGHAVAQTARAATSSTAYQSYWTGVVEVGGTFGKFLFAPATKERTKYAFSPPDHHITKEWRARQARGAIEFVMHWLPYIDEQSTSTTALMSKWKVQPVPIGQLTFPQRDLANDEAELWAALTAELGSNPANWLANVENSIAEPGTEFDCARKIAYRLSQAGRDALPESSYAHVFNGAPIGDQLADELRRRRAAKAAVGHRDSAP